MIFFFYGPNTYAARRQLRDMMMAYKDKSGSDFGLERIDGESATDSQLHSALLATPFLANSRLVIVENLGRNKTLSTKVAELIKDVPATTVAVFYDADADQRTAYFKKLKKEAKDVKFEQLDRAKLAAWVRREVANQGGSISLPAINRLLDIAGDDQWRLEQEIQKLVNYQPDITEAAIRELVTAGFDETIFELVDAIAAADVRSALRVYRGLLGAGENEIKILTMIIWQLRNLVMAKAANLPPGELARSAGISPYVAGKAMAKQARFSEDQLKAAFLLAIDTDFNIKTGQGEADQLVESLILRLAELLK